MTEHRTQFDYLLNALELASQADKPAEHGYGEKRRALFAYVRELEAKAAEDFRRRPASSEAAPSAKGQLTDAGDRAAPELVFPDGYCLDPDGRMCIPEGKHVDWDFGYECGYREAMGAKAHARAPSAEGSE